MAIWEWCSKWWNQCCPRPLQMEVLFALFYYISVYCTGERTSVKSLPNAEYVLYDYIIKNEKVITGVLKVRWTLWVDFCCCCYLVAKSCLTLWNPMDCSPPGSSVPGISRARILEWVAISISKGSSWPRDWTQFSWTACRFFTIWAMGEVQRRFQISLSTQRNIHMRAQRRQTRKRLHQKPTLKAPWSWSSRNVRKYIFIV